MYHQKETGSGYLFYVNDQTGEKQNDNPQLQEIMQVIREQHKSIQYLSYRCATKIWFLKQSFYTVNIPYSVVTSVLNHHGFTQCDDVAVLKPANLTAIIHDIFFAAEKCDIFKQSVDFNLTKCTALLANFFWNIYDPNRMVSLSLLEFKQLMLILCDTQHFGQMTTEEFYLVADHNRCVNRYRFESLIKVLSKLFVYLEENTLYRSHLVSEIIKECFEACPGMIGLNELQFSGLWQKQNIVFCHYSNVLALVYRIKESQSVVHEVECVSCKQSPIVGIRFKCQQCRKLSLCFECFCTGFKNAKHDLSHRMFEISTNVKRDNMLLSAFSNLGKCFCGVKVRQPRENNLNASMKTKVTYDRDEAIGTTIVECINTKWDSLQETKQNNVNYNSLQKAPIQNIQQEQIDTVVQRLNRQMEALNYYIALTTKNRQKQKPEFLGEHQMTLKNIIAELQLIDLRKPSAIPSSTYIPQSSTPYRNTYNRKPLAFSINSPLGNTIYASDSTRSRLDDNRSNWTLADISSLLNSKSESIDALAKLKIDDSRGRTLPKSIPEGAFEAEMQNFKELLNKIRDILDDSFSDNIELSSAAKQLEVALDSIIDAEEQKRT